jgi:RNA polymerase sigma factor (sigma-70 family)
MQNNKNDFLKLIEEHKLIIYKICNVYCKNRYNRDDLAQEITYQLWKSFTHFNGSVKFSTWMYRVALNVAITFYRKTKTAEIILYWKKTSTHYSNLLMN